VFESLDRTKRYCRMLERSGASMIAVHPRTRTQREEVLADWSKIRELKSSLHIPVIANGDCWHAEDVWLCLLQTGADAVMSAQGLLHNPALFRPLAEAQRRGDLPLRPEDDTSSKIPPLSATLSSHLRRRREIGVYFRSVSLAAAVKRRSSCSTFALPTRVVPTGSFVSTPSDLRERFDLAVAYLDCCVKCPPCHPSVVRRHLYFMLFNPFQANLDLFDALCCASEVADWRDLIARLRERAELDGPHPAAKGKLLSKKRTFRRDGTLAPPPWPVGGGGFHVSGGRKSDAEKRKKEKRKRKKRKVNETTKTKPRRGGRPPLPYPESSSQFTPSVGLF